MTSALVAAGMLTLANDAQAQQKPTNPVQLRLGGYVEEAIGVAFNRLPHTEQPASGLVPAGPAGMANTFDVQTESEIHVIGDGRLDNGLVIRAVFELEVTGSPGQTWDEGYLILRNGYGQLILGNEDPVSELMTAGYGNGLTAHAGVDMTYGTQGWLQVPATFSASPTNSAARAAFIESPDNNDSTKIIYVSPRFFGLQAGVSYAPEERSQFDQGDGAAANASGANSGGNVDPNKRLPADDLLSNMWSLGLNYEFAFSNMKVGLGTGYVSAKKPNMYFAAGPGGRTVAETPNAKMWGYGARVDMGGWRFVVGAKFARNIDNGEVGSRVSVTGTTNPGLFSTLASTAGGNNSADGFGVNFGTMYSWGPNAVSLNARHGTERGTKVAFSTDKDVIQNVIVSYARTLAPGIKWTANLLFANYDDQSGTANQADMRTGALVSTIRLDF
jgi:hypothetical protein